MRAGHFVASIRSPRSEVTSAAGVTNRMAHVDHAQIPERQSGSMSHINPMTDHGTSDRSNPAMPTTLLPFTPVASGKASTRNERSIENLAPQYCH